MFFIFYRRGGRSSRITLADRARDRGDWNTAARHYRAALERNPQRPEIWIQYGHVLKEARNFVDAEIAFRQAIRCDRSAAEPYLRLAHLLKQRGHRDRARAAFAHALARDGALWDEVSQELALRWFR